ncbi:Bifunctional protein PyrR (Includes: Pyrimidine operon regulatory protein; Uracil phosphoribosyltransferase) [uncultured Desulfobacterium sp.]|uniref:Bifunctional protein PyrR n=1 Tax=uncultured Desulfobacterium sp. TaxID=201089 RepID=A0A445N1E1_9BACT|nr:Bifunctional protein PyrR (Includes: Pyrimidine operon regulatory protein; Uracil phosphoribosyltransferase) [uncultured Desulfobacterium sp.]
MKKVVILKERDISRSINSIARAIIEKNGPMEDVVLIGIRTGGAFLAERLQEAIYRLISQKPSLGILDITLYRDDWTRISTAPVVRKTNIPFSIDDKTLILVDDVLFTGRTVRAAMDALMDYGRPKRIELAILIDRGEIYRELPIMANYSGGIWDTAPEETINVYLKEEGFSDHVAIEEKKAA